VTETDLSCSIHPVEFANAIFNAVEVSKDAGGRPGCPHVLIRYEADELDQFGQVSVYGIGRIVGGRTTLTLETQAPEDWVEVCISRKRAQELQSMLRNLGGGKAIRVSVRICEEGVESVDFDEDGEPEVGYYNLIISKADDEAFVELVHSDPDYEWTNHLALTDQILNTAKGPLQGPVAFSLEAMDRITALKGLGTKVMDLAGTERDQVVAVAAGPTFRGIIATIDRALYTDEDHKGFLLTP